MLLGYGAGSILAIAAKRSLERAPDPIQTRYFAAAAAWSAGVFAPSGLALYALYPDWMLMYLASPAHLPSVVVLPLLFLAYALLPLGGFLGTQRLLAPERRPWLRAKLAAVLLLLLLVVAFGYEALGTVAYWESFHTGGGGVSVLRSPLLLALLPGVVAVSGILAFIAMSAKRHAELVDHLPGERRSTLGPAASPSQASAPPSTSDASLPRPGDGATRGS